MERKDLLERLHTLSHYVNRGKDFNWRAGPMANETMSDGRLLISLDVDAAQFWGLHTDLQRERETTDSNTSLMPGAMACNLGTVGRRRSSSGS